MRRSKKETEAKRKAIDACRDKHGRVLPRLVVTAAKNPKSILHKEFDWDDKSAAEEQRLGRARELIREVRLHTVYEDIKIVAPFYVSDPSSSESAYIATTSAGRREEISEAVLLDELRRIESSIIRARSVAAVFDLADHFDRMLNDIVDVRGKLSGRRPSKSDDDGPRPSA